MPTHLDINFSQATISYTMCPAKILIIVTMNKEVGGRGFSPPTLHYSYTIASMCTHTMYACRLIMVTRLVMQLSAIIHAMALHKSMRIIIKFLTEDAYFTKIMAVSNMTLYYGNWTCDSMIQELNDSIL